MQRNSLYRIAEQAETEVPEISFAEALRIAEDLADALRYIHDESDASHVILHRDLKVRRAIHAISLPAVECSVSTACIIFFESHGFQFCPNGTTEAG